MKLLVIRAGRDKFSYEPMAPEHLSLREDEDADAKFASLTRDYQAWLKQGGGSCIELMLYSLHPTTREMILQTRVYETIPLRKRTVVNPELEAYRKAAGKSPASAKLAKATVEDFLANNAAMFNPQPITPQGF